MGWLGDLATFGLGGPTAASVLGPGKIADAAYGDERGVPNVQAPGVDPRYAFLGALQRRQADEYAVHAPQLKALGQGAITSGAQSDLRDTQKGIDRKASATGTYYSGRRLKQRANAAGESAGKVQQGIGDFNSSVFDTQQNLYNNAINTGLGMAGSQNQVGGLIQNQSQNGLLNSLKQRMSDQSQVGNLASGAGSFLGSYLGSK